MHMYAAHIHTYTNRKHTYITYTQIHRYTAEAHAAAFRPLSSIARSNYARDTMCALIHTYTHIYTQLKLMQSLLDREAASRAVTVPELEYTHTYIHTCTHTEKYTAEAHATFRP
jgi:hypothetical protein